MTAAPETLPRALYSTIEVAEMFGYSRQQVAAWCRNGTLRAVRLGDVGDWRIPAAVVDQLRNGT